MIMQAFCDLEPIYTYEGSYEINNLIAAREMTGFASFKPAVSTQQSRLWLLTPFLHLICWLIQFLLVEKPSEILLIKLNKLYKFYANHDEIFFFWVKNIFFIILECITFANKVWVAISWGGTYVVAQVGFAPTLKTNSQDK